MPTHTEWRAMPQNARDRILHNWHLVLDGRYYTFEELRPIVWHWQQEDLRRKKEIEIGET